jgi:hypothetical protein
MGFGYMYVRKYTSDKEIVGTRDLKHVHCAWQMIGGDHRSILARVAGCKLAFKALVRRAGSRMRLSS